MLYRRWLETCRRHADRPAIYDGDGMTTFGELLSALDRMPSHSGPVVARSGGIEFFVKILSAWRDGQAVIPLERDAPAPVLKTPPPVGTCLVKHTPGARGIFRGICFNDAQVAADGDRLVSAMGLSPVVPVLCVISPAHSYGFSNVVMPLVLHGVPVHFAAAAFPSVIREIFKKHDKLVVPGVPSVWRAWHRAGILVDAPISLAISAGAPLSLELEKEVFAASGLKIHNFYGASECGGISWDDSLVPRSSADDVGVALPGVKVRVGRGGRLRVESDSVAMADGDLTGDGCYLTPDLGRIDESGGIHLTGSVGEGINVAGRKVSPGGIEDVLLATGLILQARVCGIPSTDVERVEEIAADVELKPGVTMAQLKSAAAANLPSWELPRHWKPI